MIGKINITIVYECFGFFFSINREPTIEYIFLLSYIYSMHVCFLAAYILGLPLYGSGSNVYVEQARHL